jgi:hypothetical protein
MSFTLDPQVAEALAPFAAEMAGSTPPPVGDVAVRRAALEGVFRYADTALPFPDLLADPPGQQVTNGPGRRTPGASGGQTATLLSAVPSTMPPCRPC